jgi:hypothetical protein
MPDSIVLVVSLALAVTSLAASAYQLRLLRRMRERADRQKAELLRLFGEER